MKNIKLLTTTFFILFLISQTFSQEYKSAIGLRFGYPTSLSYKMFLNEKTAIEGFVGLRSYGFGSSFNVGAAYLLHNPITSVDGLSWYYGGGAAAYIYSYDTGFADGGSLGLGLSGYLGLEYTFKDIPLSLSTDWAPTFFLGGGAAGFAGGYGALSARYVLGRDGK
jgi:hypothetical protein